MSPSWGLGSGEEDLKPAEACADPVHGSGKPLHRLRRRSGHGGSGEPAERDGNPTVEERGMSIGRILTAVAVAIAFSWSTAAMAQEHGTKDEAKAMADAAVEHVKKVGPEQAFKDFSTDKATWRKKDLYVMALDMKGMCLGHGANEKLIGRNLIDMKDQNGVMLVAEMIKTAQAKGQGWVDYQWPNPQTQKLSNKSTYVHKLANYDGWVGVGIYR
jgi:signal transduction histidine kinase